MVKYGALRYVIFLEWGPGVAWAPGKIPSADPGQRGTPGAWNKFQDIFTCVYVIFEDLCIALTTQAFF
jgi:hypothetical protein